MMGVRRAEARGWIAALWSWAATNAPDGDLVGLDPDDIVDACDAENVSAEELTRTLVSLSLLDETENGLAIHCWMQRAGSLHNLKRIQAFRAIRRGAKYGSNVTVTLQKRNCNALDKIREDQRREDPHTVDPTSKIDTSNAAADAAPEGFADATPSALSASKINGKQFAGEVEAIRGVCAHYLTHYPQRDRQTKSEKVRSKIRARLREGFTSEQLCLAIDGMAASQFHTEGGYTGLELAMRDAAHVEAFLAKKDQPTGYKPTAWARLMNEKQREG